MATNVATLLRNGIATICDADGPIGTAGTLRNLCNRTTNLILPWRTAVTTTKPVLAYMMPANNRVGGTGDRRSVLVLLAAFADGNGAQTKVEAMVQRVRQILTPTAFLALTPSLDAVAISFTEREADDDGATSATSPTAFARQDLDILIKVTAPQ